MPDAIVIGAGVIGAAVALELQRAGRSVLVLDKGEAVGAGSTSNSAAMIRFNYSTLEGVTAAWESKFLWENWSAHLGDIDGPLARFHRVGMMFMPPPGFDTTTISELYLDVGVPNEILDPGQLAARFPWLDNSRFYPPRLPDDDHFFDDPIERMGGWWTPDAGFIDDPQLAAANLMDAARRDGAELRLRCQVTEVRSTETAGRRRSAGVTLSTGERIDAAIIVNAAGPWSSALNRLAGVDTDMVMTTRTLRQEIHVVPASEGFRVDDGGCGIGDFDLGIYCRPQPGGTALVGGVEADCDPLIWDEDPDTSDISPSVAMWETQVYRLARRVPGIEVPNRPVGIVSHYDVTPDWVPVYDRTAMDGFYVAIGTSGNQFKNAPLVGQLMATLIDACEAGHDHDHDPVQFRCVHTGHPIDLAHYGRNRQRSRSSGTVMG